MKPVLISVAVVAGLLVQMADAKPASVPVPSLPGNASMTTDNPFEDYLAVEHAPVEKPVKALAVAICEEQAFSALTGGGDKAMEKMPREMRLQHIRARDFSRMFHAASFTHLEKLIGKRLESEVLPFRKQALKRILKQPEYQKSRSVNGFLNACYQAANQTERKYGSLAGKSEASVDLSGTLQLFSERLCESFQYGLLQHNPQLGKQDATGNVPLQEAELTVQELAKSQALVTYMLGKEKTQEIVHSMQGRLRKLAGRGSISFEEAEEICKQVAIGQVQQFSKGRVR